MLERYGRLPSDVVACVGGGSNAMGIFAGFVDDPEVRLWGVEAGGEGSRADATAASLGAGSVGVLHGSRSYLLQSDEGQVLADALDQRRPRLSRASAPSTRFSRRPGARRTSSVTDAEALDAFGDSRAARASSRRSRARTRSRLRGSSRRERDAGGLILVNLSGRGDKDIAYDERRRAC